MNLVELLVALILFVIGLLVGFVWGGLTIAKNTVDRLRAGGWTVVEPKERCDVK